jgi:uncharacterized protein (TIGR02996 family)
MSKPKRSAHPALLELAGDGTVPFSPAPVQALLSAAKSSPEDDTPRLILADWLEDHGDFPRAEFLLLQCRLASGAVPPESADWRALERRRQPLLDRHGGAWLGSLWRWLPSPLCWHRGLLAARFPRRFKPTPLLEMAAWLDTLQVEVRGRLTLERAVAVVTPLELNHLFLDLRMPLGEDTLLDNLARLPESACLGSLSFSWPLGLVRHPHWQRRAGGQRGLPGAVAALPAGQTPAVPRLGFRLHAPAVWRRPRCWRAARSRPAALLDA